MRIYELCMQRAKLSKREFEIDELKHLLGVEEKYERLE